MIGNARLEFQQWWRIVLCLLGVFAHLIVLDRLQIWPLIRFGQVQLWDFDIYYQLAQAVIAGFNPYHVSFMQTLGPPLVILPFVPFAFLPLPVARGLMIGLSVGTLYLSSWFFIPQKLSLKLIRVEKVAVWLFVSGILLTSFPTRDTFITGQPTLLVMGLLTFFLQTKKPFWRAVCLNLITVFKTFFAVVLLTYVRQVGRKAWLVIGIGVGLLLVTLPLIKPIWYLEYVQQRLVTTTFSAPVAVGPDYYNQSLKAVLYRLQIGDQAVWIYPLAVMAGLLWASGKSSLKTTILISLLVSPILWQHYLVMIVPSFWVVISDQKKWRWWQVVVMLGMCWLWWVEFPSLHQQPLTLMTGVWASHYFWSLAGLTVWAICQDLAAVHSFKNFFSHTQTNRL